MPSSETCLHFSGPLTVAACEALQAELAAALQHGDDIVLQVDPSAEIDLSFLQLLRAAERSAAQRRKRVALAAPPAGEFAAALKACGLRPAQGVLSLSEIFPPDGRSVR